MISPAAERFLESIGKVIAHFLVQVVDFSVRRAVWVMGLVLIGTLLALFYAFTHFAVDTNTSHALSRDLPFQKRELAYHNVFSQDQNTIVVVLQGKNPQSSDAAVTRLETWLRARPKMFHSVYVPGGGSFFERNGLLYLSPEKVKDFADRITNAQPLIARLSADPSLGGLSDLLSMAISQRLSNGVQLPGMTAIFSALNEAVKARLEGKPYQISWSEMMGGDLAKLGPAQRFVIIQPAMNYHSLQPAEAAIRTLQAGLQSLQLNAAHGVSVGVTGGAVLDAEQLQTVSHGAGESLALTLGLEIILLSIALRSVKLVSGVLIGLVSGIILTTAWALFFVGPFNLISVAFAILFIGLGVDFGIQFCLRYREELFNGAVHRVAMHRVTQGMGTALGLAAVAAALSFYAFVPTSYAGIVDLGLISGTSMLIALLLTLTFLPAYLTLWPIALNGQHRVINYPHFTMVPTLAKHPIHRYAYWVLGLVAILAVAAIPLAMRASFDFNPLHMIDSHAEGVKVFEKLLANPDTAPYRMEVLTPNIADAQTVARRVEQLPTVARALTVDSYIPKDQSKKLAILQNLQILVPPFSLMMPTALTPPAADTRKKLDKLVKDLRALAVKDGQTSADGKITGQLADHLQTFLQKQGKQPAAMNALQNSVMGTLPGELKQLGMALSAGPVNLQTLPAALKDRYVGAAGQARVEIFPKANLSSNQAMYQFVQSVLKVEPRAVGTPVMLVQGGEAVLGAFQEATYIALASISLLLLLALRRYRDVLLIMIPLLLAALFTVAAMSLLGLSFNLGNIIVLPLLIGLGVAFAIYIVVRWRNGVDVAHLLGTSTPMAVFFSGLTTLSAFGSMAVSRDPGMASLGEALSLALAIVLLCILIILPTLMLLFTSSPREEGIAQDEGS
ncbi:MMPL family transporter [Acidithiobacillus thiooxidans]|uniref:MMPL family transporter n=1 Tax=Acidithiobacillus thiooxidans TaxID=930 RepID=UPI0004E1DBE6|nr:MMPL family transporter [Acidithiobacillus thiooxidans]MBU2835399.1 MMPL family transporter [Acidithiobacillus thiooxidans]